MRGGIPVDLPAEISQKGRANPSVRNSADRGMNLVKMYYKAKLRELISSWISKKNDVASVKRESQKVIRDYFVKSFQYGMRIQAGVNRTPKSVPISQRHYQWLIKAADQEFEHYLALMDDIRFGRTLQSNRKNWQERIEDYGNTLDSIAHAGRVAATPPNVVIYWEMDEESENCPGCIYLRDHSPYTRDNLPCTPKDGTTQCLSHCNCKLRIVKVSKEEYDRVMVNLTTKKHMLRQLEIIKNRRARR